MSDGPPRAFTDAMLAGRSDLFSKALKLCHDRDMAEDLVQETHAKALAAWRTFEPGTTMGGWLYTIMRNTYYSLHKRRSRRVEIAQSDCIFSVDVALAPEQDVKSDVEDLRRVLAVIKPAFREIIVAIYFEGLSQDQAASALGLEPGTVKSRLHRARADIARRMGVNHPSEFGSKFTNGAFVVNNNLRE